MPHGECPHYYEAQDTPLGILMVCALCGDSYLVEAPANDD